MIRERWPKLRRSSGANQRAERRSSGVFLWVRSNIGASDGFAVRRASSQTGVSSGRPAKCAARLSTTSRDMAARVSTVPLEWCG